MQTLLISGGQPLHGQVRVSGAKNAATKMMIASLLTDQPVTLRNCPDIEDVGITAEICRKVGAKVERRGDSLRLHTPEITNTTVSQLSRSNRLPVLALSPLLIRAGEANLPTVGGDKIGPRPVNFHVAALRSMGAEITENDGRYLARTAGLCGADLKLPYPSVGATENAILAAVLARGQTTIHNAAVEPEIMDLIKMLQQMGAIIEFRTDRTLKIEGVERLIGVDYTIMPDRLEAASFGLLAAATDGEILVRHARQDDLLTFLNTLRRIGVDYRVQSDGICFRRGTKPLRSVMIETDAYPGFSTDWQQPTAVLLTQARGRSSIHETVYEDRFGYTESLNQMGAEIEVSQSCLGNLSCRFKDKAQNHSAIINGPTPLHAANIIIPDIRAGMAHVLASLIADGQSELSGIEHLLRGYEDFLGKLQSVGANFSPVQLQQA